MSEGFNKNISIHYNLFNLPEKVTVGNPEDGNYLIYVYSSSGKKLAKKVYQDNILANTRESIGEFEYENQELKLVYFNEGVVPTSKMIRVK